MGDEISGIIKATKLPIAVTENFFKNDFFKTQ